MKAIFKYSIRSTGVQSIEVAEDAEFLAAQMQNGALCLWALVTRGAPLVVRRVGVYGTGWDLPAELLSGMRYLATAQNDAGAFVWHVFVPEVPS